MRQTPFILSAQIRADAPLYDPTFSTELMQRAEFAQIDLAVLGEVTASAVSGAEDLPAFESIIVAAALAPLTRGVGLIAVVSALHAEPFHVARAMSALDFLAAGRSGWLPTTACVDWARYGGVGQVSADEYLAKSVDFIAATESLWDSWDSDALIIDQSSGTYLHSDRVRRSDYHGRFHEVQGPLNAARPPQGYPLQLRSERDLTGRAAASSVRPADVSIVNLGALPARDGSKRIARVAARDATPAALASWTASFGQGDIDGLHLTLADPLADLAWFGATVLPQLRALGVSVGSGRDRSLRERFGLPIPRSRAETARRGEAA